MIKKVGIFNPYLDSLGGGERYILTIAECLSKKYQVDVFWQDQTIRKKIENRFNLNISEVNFCSKNFQIFTAKQNLLKKFKILRKYSVFFYLSDGSVTFLFAKKNFLHFQVPFHDIGGKSVLNRIKLKLIDGVICNSFFTKKFIDREYGLDSLVVYPPVDVDKFKPLKKENLILSVGRFDSPLHNKKQDFLIKVFKKIYDQGLKGWQLILIGGCSINQTEYLKKLKLLSQNYPIKILVNTSFETLKKYYGKAKIYWHAAGFGVDQNKEPERVEHFGITTVEAMAAGAVPVVINTGGQPEIVKNNQNGFLWNTEEELMRFTVRLIKQKDLWQRVSLFAQKRSQKFSKKNFCKKINYLVI